jgi:uncharacterized protein (TIGR03437 family)
MLLRARMAALVLAGPLLSQQDPAIVIRLERVVSGLRYPTDLHAAGDGTGRLFVVEQAGRIRVLRNGALLPAPFLDISSRVTQLNDEVDERGLLGIAVPPGFATKLHFYVNYTDRAGDTVISRFRVSADPDRADPASEQILLTIEQPFANHNGGKLAFGPDGFLYVGAGDGGGGGDPLGHGQNRGTLLGKMLRLDVDSDPRQVLPARDNPFVRDNANHPFLWAIGLRNPWRFSFDRLTGDLWIGDVGQDRLEEVNFQPASSRGGENYGWNLLEASECLIPGCRSDGLTPPVAEYDREGGCAVVGGFVYRGAQFPALWRTYVYADFCTGRIWGLRREGGAWRNRLLLASRLFISTFGEDEAGEILLADHGGGGIYRVIAGPAPASPSAVRVVAAGNAASGAGGLVAGSLATIYGSGFTDAPGVFAADRFPLPPLLRGVSILLNGRLARVLSVSRTDQSEQINVQVPFELANARTASVVVVRDGQYSTPLDVPVHVAQPGVFTRDGTQALLVRHPDNTLVTREAPLRAGEVIYFYATGLGPAENNPATGNPAPRSPPARTLSPAQVTIGGVTTEVLYSGLAPDLAGVYQINVRTPATLASGETDLVVAIGGAASPPARVPVR